MPTPMIPGPASQPPSGTIFPGGGTLTTPVIPPNPVPNLDPMNPPPAPPGFYMPYLPPEQARTLPPPPLGPENGPWRPPPASQLGQADQAAQAFGWMSK